MNSKGSALTQEAKTISFENIDLILKSEKLYKKQVAVYDRVWILKTVGSKKRGFLKLQIYLFLQYFGLYKESKKWWAKFRGHGCLSPCYSAHY